MQDRTGVSNRVAGVPAGVSEGLVHGDLKARRLSEKVARVVQRDSVDRFVAVSATFHFQPRLWYRQRMAAAPVSSGVHPDEFGTIHLDNVNRSLRRDFGVRKKRHAGPEASIEYLLNSMFFDMINAAGGECIHDGSRTLEFVFRVRSVYQDHLIVAFGQGEQSRSVELQLFHCS